MYIFNSKYRFRFIHVAITGNSYCYIIKVVTQEHGSVTTHFKNCSLGFPTLKIRIHMTPSDDIVLKTRAEKNDRRAVLKSAV